jgi:ribosomal protein S18 acetylase RimI-like enzyme
MTGPNDAVVLGRIETYLDAAPRSATEPEAAGKFTLFRPTGPWKFYARPRLGLDQPIDRSDVDALRSRQRELDLPEKIEWVAEMTPSLASAASESGLSVHGYPLLVLGGREGARADLPNGISVRLVDADDEDFARVHAVANVGFGAAGTQIGPEGADERDEQALAMKPQVLEFMRDRAREGWSVSYAAFDESGPIAVGTHQPVAGATEIVGVATLPSARRRGVAAALVAALVEDAIARGVTTVFLGADSDDVARVYERVGFKRIGSTGAAELPE